MGTPRTDRSEVEAQVEHVIVDLRSEFPQVPHDVVEDQVHRAERRLEGARITTFVPVLVRREARAVLRRISRP